MDGWVNCDLSKHAPCVDEAFDLMADWPFPDNSADMIYASHVLEHLPNHQHFFDEAHRVCKPFGQVQLRVPYGGSSAAWADLTHLRPWYPASFAYLQPGYAAAVGNAQYQVATAAFAIDLVQVKLHPDLMWWWRRKWVRTRLHRWFQFVDTVATEVYASLLALKDDAACEAYAAVSQANIVPQTFVVYQHEWEGRALAPGELLTLHTLA